MFLMVPPRLQMRALATALTVAMATLALPAAAAPRLNLSGLDHAQTHQEFLVKYRSSSLARTDGGSLQRSLDRVARGTDNGGSLGLRAVQRLAIGTDVVRASRALDRVQAATLMRQFAADPDVEYVELNGTFNVVGFVPDRKADAIVPLGKATKAAPNDELFPKQWDLTDPKYGIFAEKAWETTQGEGSVVAVLDTGYLPHSDLVVNILPGYDFITDPVTAGDGDGRDADAIDSGDFTQYNGSSWHGTHVSGTIAAVTNNGKGIAGIAYKAKILPVRVLGKKGGKFSDLVDAMVWAAGGSVPGIPNNPTPADVLNMSLSSSGDSCSNAVQESINASVALGATLVAAAGNSNSDVARESPANCDNIIAVGSTDPWGWRSNFSCWGEKLDVAAPGRRIFSTYNAGKNQAGEESYFESSGTSMAAPHVAAVIALMQSAVDTRMTPAQVESTLKLAARPWTEAPDKPIGPGYLDAGRAVAKACELKGCTGQTGTPPVSSFKFVVDGLKASFTDASTDADGKVTAWSWDFGDGSTSTERNPAHAYAKAGSYSVTLKVTDDSGKTASSKQTVDAKDAPAGDVLANDKPVAVAGAQASETRYTMQVPDGQSRLSFTLNGGSGDADLYVKFGAAPTTSSYDCRPYKSGNDEVCTLTPKAGTWHVMVRAFKAYDGATLTGSYAASGGGLQTYANEADVVIIDRDTVRSPVKVSGRDGAKGQADTRVNVDITHTYIGDLTVTLLSPSGKSYVLHNRSGGSADDLKQAYTLDLSGESLNGDWTLQVADAARGDNGTLNRWDITF